MSPERERTDPPPSGEAQRRLAAIVESSEDAVIGRTRDGLIDSWNDGAQRIYGYSADEAVGRPYAMLVPEVRLHETNDLHLRVLSGERVRHYETVRLAKDGQAIDVSISMAPVRNARGEITGAASIHRDITEQKRAQAAIAYHARLLEGLNDAVIATDASFRITAWNPAAERIYGWRPDEVLGRPVADVLKPEYVGLDRDQAVAVLVETGGLVAESNQLRKAGTAVVIEGASLALRDDKGIVTGYVSVNRDVTARREAEQRVRRSEAQLAEAQAIAHVGSLEWDLRTNEVWWSDELYRICGLDKQTVRAPYMAFLEHVHPDDRDLVQGAVRAARRDGKPFAFEHRVARPGGEIRWLHVRGRTGFDEQGDPVRIAITAHDVTDRKEAEEARLRLAEEQAARRIAEDERWRAAFLAEASALLAASLDYPGTLCNVAELAVPRFADWCTVDLLAEPDQPAQIEQVAVAHADPRKLGLVRELRLHDAPDPEAPRGVSHVLRTGKSELYADAADLLPGGTRDEEHLRILRELGIRSAMVVPVTARGRILGAIAFAAAESGRRYTHADLRTAEDLGWRAGIAIDNARLYRLANEAIAARDEFLSVASHELRTPLTPLQLQLQMLRRALPAERGNGKLQGKVDTATRQVERLTRLVDGLLDLSRINAGRLELQPEDVDLAELVREIAERFADEARAQQCELRLRLAPGVVGRWDRLRLEQIVVNLLSNAMKYGAGSPVELGVDRGVGHARLTVSDQGVGIAAGDLERIFGRFERAVSVRSLGGLGLGLYITRQIVESHDGRIHATGTPGGGATFVVELPLWARPEPPGAPGAVALER